MSFPPFPSSFGLFTMQKAAPDKVKLVAMGNSCTFPISTRTMQKGVADTKGGGGRGETRVVARGRNCNSTPSISSNKMQKGGIR